MPGCWMLEGLEWIGGGDGGDRGHGRRGLEESLTRSSFRSSADYISYNNKPWIEEQWCFALCLALSLSPLSVCGDILFRQIVMGTYTGITYCIFMDLSYFSVYLIQFIIFHVIF